MMRPRPNEKWVWAMVDTPLPKKDRERLETTREFAETLREFSKEKKRRVVTFRVVQDKLTAYFTDRRFRGTIKHRTYRPRRGMAIRVAFIESKKKVERRSL